MFSPPVPTTVLVLRVPFPWRMVMLSMPVPLMPSVRLAMNSHWEEAQSDEEDGQLVEELTTWHTGRLTSVTWRHRKWERWRNKIGMGEYTNYNETGKKTWTKTAYLHWSAFHGFDTLATPNQHHQIKENEWPKEGSCFYDTVKHCKLEILASLVWPHLSGITLFFFSFLFCQTSILSCFFFIPHPTKVHMSLSYLGSHRKPQDSIIDVSGSCIFCLNGEGHLCSWWSTGRYC